MTGIWRKNMRINKKIVTSMVFILLSYESLVGAEGDEQAMNVTKNEIQYLHKKIAEVAKTLKGDNVKDLEIPMGSGLNQRAGSKTRYVYYEAAVVTVSGDTLSSIKLNYTQSNYESLVKEYKEMVNNNPADLDCKDLTLRFKVASGGDESLKIADISKDEKKFQLLVKYRDWLNNLLRIVMFHAEKADTHNEKNMDQALTMGDKI